MKRIILPFLIMLFCLFFPTESVLAQPYIKIMDYPKNVYAGETTELKVEWGDIPTNKDYLLRIQLENWDVGLCIMRDTENLPSTGIQTVSLEVPSNFTLNPTNVGFRFVVAFLSREKGWQDVSCSHATEKDVGIKSHISIIDYPMIVTPGKPARVRITWDKAPPLKKEYNLILQLENVEARPQVYITKTITQFKSADTVIVTLDIPMDLKNNPFVSGYRFVAAFISRSKEWRDIYSVDVTPRNVEIWKQRRGGL